MCFVSSSLRDLARSVGKIYIFCSYILMNHDDMLCMHHTHDPITYDQFYLSLHCVQHFSDTLYTKCLIKFEHIVVVTSLYTSALAGLQQATQNRYFKLPHTLQTTCMTKKIILSDKNRVGRLTRNTHNFWCGLRY